MADGDNQCEARVVWEDADVEINDIVLQRISPRKHCSSCTAKSDTNELIERDRQIVVVLPEVDQERMLQVLHDLQLFQDVPHLVPLHTFQFVHVFHGVHLLGVLLLHNADLIGPQKIDIHSAH